MLKGFPVNVSNSFPVEQKQIFAAMKLPKLNFPQFSGDVEYWFEISDCFETSIHLNKSLSKVEKFAYLKSL